MEKFPSQQISSEIKKAGLLSSGRVYYESIIRKSDRLDYFDFRSYRAFQDNGSAVMVHYGIGLEEQWSKSKAFSAASSEITVKPLLFFKVKEKEVFITEFFDGQSLEQAIEDGTILPSDAKSLAFKVLKHLECTYSNSDENSYKIELCELLSEIKKCRLFNALDQDFISSQLFNLILEEGRNLNFRKRWTNGDLIGRNILRNKAGQIKLIDYEFAKNTHFYWEDYFRWKSFSNFEGNEFLNDIFEPQIPHGRGFEVLFLLNQILLDYEVFGANLALQKLSPKIARLKEIAELENAGLKHSVFFSSKAEDEPASTTNMISQLFWSKDETYSEDQSFRELVTLDQSQIMEVDLVPDWEGPVYFRFDPCNGVGVIEISEISIMQSDGALLYLMNKNSEWGGIRCGRELLELSRTNSMVLFSHGIDPSIRIPPVEFQQDIKKNTLRVRVRFGVFSEAQSIGKVLKINETHSLAIEVSQLKDQLKGLKSKVSRLNLKEERLLETEKEYRKLTKINNIANKEMLELLRKFELLQEKFAETQIGSKRELEALRKEIQQKEIISSKLETTIEFKELEVERMNNRLKVEHDTFQNAITQLEREFEANMDEKGFELDDMEEAKEALAQEISFLIKNTGKKGEKLHEAYLENPTNPHVNTFFGLIFK